MGVVEDYVRKGGGYGHAWNCLCEQFLIAKQNPQHPLRPVLNAIQKKDMNLASSVFYKVLADAAGNDQSPLRYAFTYLYTVPLFKEAVKFVKANAENEKALQDIPLPILRLGLIDYGFTAKASASAKNKGKTTRDVIIAAWEAEFDKSNYSLFATRLYKRLGGKNDHNDNKENKKIPSERTIAKIVSKYERDKKSLLFASKRQDKDHLK